MVRNRTLYFENRSMLHRKNKHNALSYLLKSIQLHISSYIHSSFTHIILTVFFSILLWPHGLPQNQLVSGNLHDYFLLPDQLGWWDLFKLVVLFILLQMYCHFLKATLLIGIKKLPYSLILFLLPGLRIRVLIPFGGTQYWDPSLNPGAHGSYGRLCSCLTWIPFHLPTCENSDPQVAMYPVDILTIMDTCSWWWPGLACSGPPSSLAWMVIVDFCFLLAPQLQFFSQHAD